MSEKHTLRVREEFHRPGESKIEVLYAVVGDFENGTEAVAAIQYPDGVRKDLVGDNPYLLREAAQRLVKGSGHSLRLLRFVLDEVVDTFEAQP